MKVERGISVTTVPRTIFDLAAIAPPEQVESALRQSEYLRLHDRLSLHDLLDRYPGRRGARAIRAALARRAERPGRTRSPLEERFFPFIDRHHLPRPRLNAWIQLPERMVQVDCLWPETMNVVELDGWEGHGTRTAFHEDRARDRALRVAGYEVTRVTWPQLDDEPSALVDDLRSLLQRPSSNPRNHT
jgi:very-short-patch-repair endonuclease